jgi:4-hydroxybenzoate polyprenyltransferase/phosphoserine phosphatase
MHGCYTCAENPGIFPPLTVKSIQGQLVLGRVLQSVRGDTEENRLSAAVQDGTTTERPLCVDLDGTLVKSDTLVDSLLLLLRAQPLAALQAPLWLLRGKAALKAQVSARVALDERNLPYNRVLLEYLGEQRQQGRKVYLATGADERLAQRIADHLGLFEGVLASDGSVNRTGGKKLDGLQQAFGEQRYDYVGNAGADVPLLQHAEAAMIANPSSQLRARLRSRGVAVRQVFRDRAQPGKSFLKAIRLHQWAKNVLVFLPVLLAHRLGGRGLLQAAIAFASFSLCASATYIVNDLLDMEADRRHPRKRLRPFAAGDLSAAAGATIGVVFLAASLAMAAGWLPREFLMWLLLYLAATLSYSLYLKRVVLVDVLLLAGLYTVRLLAGGAATRVTITPWLAAFALFLFLSLAMVKRFSELQNTRERGQVPANGRGYLLGDIEQLRSFGTACAYAAVVVFSFYIGAQGTSHLYRHPLRLWLVTPLMIYWLSRVWLLASRGELNEDPVIFAVTDRVSLLIGVLVAAVAASAAL